MSHRPFRLLLAVMLVFSLSVNAQEKKVPSFEDIINLKSPGSVRLSPDASRVLYTVSEPNWENNEYITQIWMVDVASGENRQLTFAKKSSFNPDWSPDGKWISFVSGREEKSQIYLMSVFGGEAKALTKAETGINGYAWSPDSTHIAFSAPDDLSAVTKTREKKYGRYEFFEEEHNVNRLWNVDVATGATEKIVDRADLHVGGFNWSPDGAAIAFSASPDTLLSSSAQSDIYIVTVADKSIRPLVSTPGAEYSPVWSPDGAQIAFASKLGSDKSFVNTVLCVVPAAGGSITPLSKGFDENVSPSLWNAAGIWFGAYRGMQSHLFRIDLTGAVTQVSTGEGRMYFGGSLNGDGTKVAMTMTDAANYTEIYLADVATFSLKKLTGFGAQIEGWTLSTKEPISWKSTDGTEITGVLYKPADFDAKKKYPLFVIIHGGPTGISTPTRHAGYGRYYPIEQWCAKGAVVLEPNYRGSAGFGEKFRSLNYRNLGVGDYWDVISGVDHLIARGFVDKERVASMGWSQGGYISAFITTNSDRFRAVSVGAGISDWVTYYYKTDITSFCLQYLGATPWADPAVYALTSPMTNINKAKTPTLIQHGENDLRVPITNAHKLYRGLKDRGVPVRFIIYKGFGHGITKPKENLAVLTHNWQWFARYIWGEDIPDETFEEKKPEAAEK